jgi:crotonobetainyl-CoA:carnitine CoA-transferase CaiB-like acyl-CoA transferase
MVVEVPYAPAGRLKMTANPIRMSVTPLDCVSPPPLLGEHQPEIFHQGTTAKAWKN